MVSLDGCLSLPLNHYVGVQFRPTDQQLLHYLYCKIYGHPYFQGAVFDFDLYGGIEPWEIWQKFEGIDGKDLYFFTKLKRSIKNSGHLSAHINRKIGLANGTWSGENSATPIFANEADEQIIGYRKRFRYENNELHDHHGEWIMHEYSLHQHHLMGQSVDPNYVLCRIRKNERAKTKLKIRHELQQPKKKRRTTPKISNNERPKKKAKKRCFVELQQTEQRVTTLEQMISNLHPMPNMTTNQDISVVDHLGDMTTHQDINVVAQVVDMTTNNEDINVVAHVANMATNNQDSNVMAHVADMTTNQDNLGMFDPPLMITNEDISFGIEDVPYTSTNDEWIDSSNSGDIHNNFDFQPDMQNNFDFQPNIQNNFYFQPNIHNNFDAPLMITNEDISFGIEDVPYTSIGDEWIDSLNLGDAQNNFDFQPDMQKNFDFQPNIQNNFDFLHDIQNNFNFQPDIQNNSDEISYM